MLSKLLIYVFLGALYLPLFGRVLPPFRERQETFVNYGLPLALLCAVAAVIYGLRGRAIEGFKADPLFWPFVLLGGYVLIWTIKGTWAGLLNIETLTVLRTKMTGPLYGLCTIVVLRALHQKERYSLLVPAILIGALLLQIGLSTVESIRGEGFGKYEIGWVGQIELEQRDMLAGTGINPLSALGLKIPLSGQIGQHNGFGNMLLFYNLLLLALLLEERKRWWIWPLLGVVILALVANTTRVALLACLIGNALVLPASLPRWRMLRIFASVATIFGVLVATYLLWDFIFQMTTQLDSLSIRLNLWALALEDAWESLTTFSAMFGFSAETLSSIGILHRQRALGSVENQFLALFLDVGLVGLIMFILVFIVTPIKATLIPCGRYKPLKWAFVFGLVFCGMTMDLHLHFTSIALLLVVYDRMMKADIISIGPRSFPMQGGDRLRRIRLPAGVALHPDETK